MGNVVDIKSRKQTRHAEDSKPKVKTYVFDTSALIQYPHVLENANKCTIVIPIVAIGELDHKKTDSDPDIARAARGIANLLNFWSGKGSSSKGISLAGGVKFYIYGHLDVDFHLESKVDSLVIGTAMKFRADYNMEAGDITVLSTDTNLRTMAETQGFKSDMAPDDYDLFPGTLTLSEKRILGMGDKTVAEPERYWHQESFNLRLPRISRTWKVMITGVLLMASSVVGIVLTYPAAVMDALKTIKEYAKYTVPVALGAGLIGGMSLIIGKAVGFLKLRKLQKSFPGIREGESEDDWMFRKMPEAVADEYFRGKKEEKKTGT